MAKNGLYDSFIYPPFSTLSARSGQWQERKNKWLDLGFRSGLGRPADLLGSMESANQLMAKIKGTEPSRADWTTQSIFDPVLTELCCAWFSAKDDKILDPFAGGSVRGLVAGFMQRRYLGFDIRPEQIEENIAQLKKLKPATKPVWRVGDATRLHKSGARGKFDLILTCPPYGDLEKYSDNPDDISNMPYEVFLGAFRQSVQDAARMLNDNRFAVYVVGDFRDRNGNYRGFVADTIKAGVDAGMKLYNDAVLLTALGTSAVRARGGFEASRKLTKAHQNVLVFVKGDPKIATERIGTVQRYDFDQ